MKYLKMYLEVNRPRKAIGDYMKKDGKKKSAVASFVEGGKGTKVKEPKSLTPKPKKK